MVLFQSSIRDQPDQLVIHYDQMVQGQLDNPFICNCKLNSTGCWGILKKGSWLYQITKYSIIHWSTIILFINCMNSHKMYTTWYTGTCTYALHTQILSNSKNPSVFSSNSQLIFPFGTLGVLAMDGGTQFKYNHSILNLIAMLQLPTALVIYP